MSAKLRQERSKPGPDRRKSSGAAEKRRRLPRGARKARIIEEAARHFADHGFAASTRDLAQAMGVAQALLYRYFSSKRELIDQIFETLFVDRWRPEWDDLIRDRTIPLETRLTRFYEAYLGNVSAVSMRLFMRAALDGQGFPDRYTLTLNDRVLKPIVAELRHTDGLRDGANRRLLGQERELAMMLHGSVVFLGIRKHIYGTPLSADLGPQVALYVRTFLAGAKERLREIDKKRAAGRRTKKR